MSLLEVLKTIEDHRDPHGREYKLSEILFITILAILSNSKTYTDIERFMQEHFETLKRVFDLKWRRVPHFSSIRDIIVGIEPKKLEEAFRLYSSRVDAAIDADVRHICFDGKALNGSFSHTKDKRALIIFNVFAKHSLLTLAHLPVEEKTNEIGVFQEFLVSLNLRDVIVTADAMHCQKKLLNVQRGLGQNL
jgi:hypothetical protein